MVISCVKYIVLIYNFIFWLLGVAILGFSILLYAESHNYVNFEDTQGLFDTPFFLIIILGAVMTLVGFLGCCGAIRESTCLLGTYILLCITMGVACGAAVWWSNEYRTDVSEKVQTSLQKMIRENYRGNLTRPTTEVVIDRLQKDMQCCGARNLTDWSVSRYNQGNRPKLEIGIGKDRSSIAFSVPASCCRVGAPDCEVARKGITMDNLESKKFSINNEGCLHKLDAFVGDKWTYLILIGMTLIGCQILALLFTCCFCCFLSGQKNNRF
ncbi:CD151 antigen [Tetranychus urticae]|uniref:Tetraspanin n=1 Tax=Tetranychus urticae TaxID=32264 RepID=T1KKN8_TETUR|nr:CD151 antigen [Tetranychus urticae]